MPDSLASSGCLTSRSARAQRRVSRSLAASVRRGTTNHPGPRLALPLSATRDSASRFRLHRRLLARGARNLTPYVRGASLRLAEDELRRERDPEQRHRQDLLRLDEERN